MRRYLPLAVLTTCLVIALPAVLVAAIVPRGSPLLMVASGASAVAVSMAIATAGAALWKRQRRSRDVVFADLLLWGWLRRCWTERRLSQARDLYDSAKRAGPTVSIELLTGLSRRLEARDAYTHGHGQRVARHAGRIARAMHLSPIEIAKIRTAATVHDVGKLHTPREILNNPGRLTDAEFAVMKRHAVKGAEMLAAVGDSEIAAMVRHHHERIDGHGYPDGLAGSDISIGARIIAVADTFDAITSNRAYRRASTQKKALDVLSKRAGSQLDSVAVAAFHHRYSARRSVAWFAFATAVPQRIFTGLQTASQSFGAGVGGATSILPALGAAGLLSLSPVLHQNTSLVQHAHRLPALTHSHAPPIPAASTTHASRHYNRHTASANSPRSGSHPSHRTAPISPSAPRSTNPTASAPNTPATGTASTPGREPVAAAPTPPPTTSPPPPTPPTTAPPVNVPRLPAPPISPPVTLPNVPTVNLPPVHVPSASGPSLAIPTT